MINARQRKILQLISTMHISKQEELRELLRQEGFPVTQATISRDIRTLQLSKIADDEGNYYYQEQDFLPAQPNLFSGNVIEIDYAGNTLVIKCSSGTAQAVCTIIDTFAYPEIVGTLAGDDTIFILVRTSAQAKKLADKLMEKIAR